MAFGDIGGAVTELVITCQTKAEGRIDIKAGDAVRIVGPYTIDHAHENGDPIFGQALASASTNSAPVPVKVRGVSIFEYDDDFETPEITKTVNLSNSAGKVKTGYGAGRGIVVKVDERANQVHVLL